MISDRTKRLLSCAAVIFSLCVAAGASASAAEIPEGGLSASGNAAAVKTESVDTEPVVVNAGSEPKIPDGWRSEDGGRAYYIGGEAQNGAVEIDGTTYLFERGFFSPSSGWKTIDGKKYRFVSGIADEGKTEIDGMVFVFDEHGVLVSENGWSDEKDPLSGKNEKLYEEGSESVVGFKNIDGKLYYFDNAGRRNDFGGFKTIFDEASGKDKLYYFTDGYAATGFKKIGGEIYYFDENGVCRETDGWATIGGKKYYFSNGCALTGIKEADGKLCYFAADGVFSEQSGFITFDGFKYLLKSGVVQTGIVSEGGKSYFLNPQQNGRMETRLIDYGGNIYFADDSGELKTGLVQVSGKTYYFGGSFAAVTGWQTIGSTKYYFGSEKYALTGWFTVGGAYYYGGTNGAVKTNCAIDGYYVGADGRRASTKAAALACDLIASCTNSSMTQEQKLRACYTKIISICSYKRDYEDPTVLPSGWTGSYAEQMLSQHKGNCFRYASALAYIAKELGYDARVATGRVAAAGGGTTPHGWTELNIGGTLFILDANLDDSKGTGFKFFMKTYGNYPYYLSKQKTFEIKL